MFRGRQASMWLLRRAQRQRFMRSPQQAYTPRPQGTLYRYYSSPASTEFLHSKSRPVLTSLVVALCGAAVGFGLGHAAPKQADAIRYAERHDMIKAAIEIQDALGEDAVSYDDDDIEAHGFSDWSSVNTSNRAVAIVYPTTTDQVSTAVKICHEYCVPVVPYGAGSSVEGNFAAPHGGIVLDLRHMDQIVSFNPNDMDVVVQPGVNWMDLNTMTQAENLFLPLDPSPTATIGGMVSTNCSGTNAFRYGTMKDWVINVTVVLADGRVIKTRRRPRKSSAGYNLTSLFVGSEGTLGVVTEITLKLAVVPRETSVAVVSFQTIAEAAEAASKLIRSGVQLAAMELMDEVQMQIVNRHGSEAVRKMKWDESPALFLKFSGPSKDAVDSDVCQVRDLISTSKPTRFVFAKNKDEEAQLWAARKEALWTMTSIKPEGHSIWSTDVAVPISRLAEIINMSKREGEKLGVFSSIVGHVGDGNFHEALMYDPKDRAHQTAVEGAVHNMMARALEMEGTVSGEHAIGMGKIQCLVDELGPDTIQVMKQLKQALDPRWIMNPGKVFLPPPIRST